VFVLYKFCKVEEIYRSVIKVSIMFILLDFSYIYSLFLIFNLKTFN
jgi:hypothetical protein